METLPKEAPHDQRYARPVLETRGSAEDHLALQLLYTESDFPAPSFIRAGASGGRRSSITR
jgi:hypothetical protein